MVGASLIFSDASIELPGDLDRPNCLLRSCNCPPLGLICPSSCHLLGFICPSNFICSLLNCLFAYHFPPRQPKPYLQFSKRGESIKKPKRCLKLFHLSSSKEEKYQLNLWLKLINSQKICPKTFMLHIFHS